MDSNQPTSSVTYVQSSSPVMTPVSKIPSSAAFAVAILLFLMPFVDIKCNGTSLQTISGVQLATGFQMKNNSSDNSLLNDLKTDTVDEGITKATTKSDKKDPNMYALIALAVGVLGLGLSFTNGKAAIGGAMIAGIASAGAMIGMMLDIKKKVKLDMPGNAPSGKVGDKINEVGDKVRDLADNVKITVDFTPWFYISVVAFLVAAFFCYRRMASKQ